jgi:hypothetical protein
VQARSHSADRAAQNLRSLSVLSSRQILKRTYFAARKKQWSIVVLVAEWRKMMLGAQPAQYMISSYSK